MYQPGQVYPAFIPLPRKDCYLQLSKTAKSIVPKIVGTWHNTKTTKGEQRVPVIDPHMQNSHKDEDSDIKHVTDELSRIPAVENEDLILGSIFMLLKSFLVIFEKLFRKILAMEDYFSYT